MNATPMPDLQLVDLEQLEKYWTKRQSLAAAGMLCIGIYVGWSIPDEPAIPVVRKEMLQIGQHLCRHHEGLANIQRVGDHHYTFTCQEIAVMPNVRIHIK